MTKLNPDALDEKALAILRAAHEARHSDVLFEELSEEYLAIEWRCFQAALSAQPEQAAPVEVTEAMLLEEARSTEWAIDPLINASMKRLTEKLCRMIDAKSATIAQLREEVERLEDSAHHLAADKIGLENDLAAAEERADKAEQIIYDWLDSASVKDPEARRYVQENFDRRSPPESAKETR